jgi:hypothetical protein
LEPYKYSPTGGNQKTHFTCSSPLVKVLIQ